MKIILASQSKERKIALDNAGYDSEVIVSTFDESEKESGDYTNLEEYVKDLALCKAMDVAFDKDDGIIIGADTIVIFNRTIFEKPKDMNDAVRMLTMLSGQWHEVLTGIAIINAETEEKVIDAVKCRVKFKELTKEEIQKYVNTGEPLEKAGAYNANGGAKDFIEEIQGSKTGVYGLPMERVSEILKSMTSSE